MSLKSVVDHYENTASDRRVLSRKLGMAGSPFKLATKLAFKRLKREGYKIANGFWEGNKYRIVMYKLIESNNGETFHSTATIIETPKCTGSKSKKCKIEYDSCW